MSNFILRYKKSVELVTVLNARQFQEEFFKQIDEKLKNSYVKEIHKKDNQIIFKATIGRFSWNAWNIFNPITKGTIKLDIKKEIPVLTYEVCFYEFFVIALLMSLTAIPAYFFELSNYAIGLLLINWLLFYLGSKIITAIRLKSFFEKIRKKVNNPSLKLVSYKELFKEDIDFINEVFIRQDNDFNRDAYY